MSPLVQFPSKAAWKRRRLCEGRRPAYYPAWTVVRPTLT